MRLKWQRRIRKHLRRMRGRQRTLAVCIARLERNGLSLTEALRAILLDPARFHQDRAASGKLLAIAGDDEAVQALLGLFFEQTAKDHLYATALTIECLNDRRAVPPLIRALLQDDNPHRRHAAAREEAAESLAYVGTRQTIAPLRFCAPRPGCTHPLLGRVRIGRQLSWRPSSHSSSRIRIGR